jgi:TolA-binding protein
MFLFKTRDTGEMEYKLGSKYFDQQKYAEAELLLRESVQQREKVLGAEHVDTLLSKYMLAFTLYEQQKYGEAEQLWRESAQQREKVLGAEHVDTLESKYQLAVMLHKQQKYGEAEQLWRESVQQREKVLGAEHVDTLESKYWLAFTLHKQQKYGEAEQLLRESVQQWEKVLGAEHVDTLWSKHMLADTLYEQQKYGKAEPLLRESVQQREKVLGAEHVDTLLSKYMLAFTLHEQQKYGEAEQLWRELVQQREKVLGAEHVGTLHSKYRLADTLHKQQKYGEAEQLWRESAQQREKVLGAEHVGTLHSKYRLADTLHKQQKYGEAEQLLRESVQQREKVLGGHHKDTLASKELLQKVVLAKVPPAPTNALAETVFSRLSDFFTDGSQTRTAYTDSEIQQVSILLSQVNLQWSKVPRTYMVLRIIGCLDLLDAFIDLGLSDHWLPFTERSLPPHLRPSKRSQFVGAQNLVMTKSMDLEKGERGQHCYFRQDEPLPLEMKGILGSGGFGQVNRVLSTISFQEYALKRVSRSAVFSGRTEEDNRRRAECVKQFIAEIGALKRLKHHHVVEFVGSYTDAKYIGLIMSPVADMDLSAYLADVDTARYRELRTFFGCLARALAFLHEQSIRHKDIKPSNILVHGGNVLFTDFGLAFDFTDKEGSTTVSMVNGMTPRYCAPEVADCEPRNTSSDIWSLGVVFLEMTAVLKGRTVAYMYNFLKAHGSGQAYVRTNPTGTDALVAELKETGSPTDNAALGWVHDMVMLPQQLRPTAASLMASITGAGQRSDRNEAFCGICCASPDDFLDDLTS